MITGKVVGNKVTLSVELELPAHGELSKSGKVEVLVNGRREKLTDIGDGILIACPSVMRSLQAGGQRVSAKDAKLQEIINAAVAQGVAAALAAGNPSPRKPRVQHQA
jgi:hypothetical protein